MNKKKLNLRQRLVFKMARFVWWWDDTVPGKYLPDKDWAFMPSWGVINKFCRVMRAHVVTDDQCNKPEHRYCIACGRQTPNEEVSYG